MLEALFATIVVAASFITLFYLGSLVLSAASLPLGSLLERQRFARHVERARRGDQCLQQGNLEQALIELRSAFYLYAVHNRNLASAVANHHTGLLARLISITTDLQGGTVRLLSLAKADRLLSERSDLQRRYFAARQGASRERRREVLTRMNQNGTELEAALQQLLNEVRNSRRPVVYY